MQPGVGAPYGPHQHTFATMNFAAKQIKVSHTQEPSDTASLQVEGAAPGLAKSRSVPARFKRRLADCLSPGATFRVSKHHKLVESQRPSRSPAPSPERISTDGALVEPRHQRGHAAFQGAPPVSASFLAEEAQSLEGQLPPGLPLAPVDEHREVRLLVACGLMMATIEACTLSKG